MSRVFYTEKLEDDSTICYYVDKYGIIRSYIEEPMMEMNVFGNLLEKVAKAIEDNENTYIALNQI